MNTAFRPALAAVVFSVCALAAPSAANAARVGFVNNTCYGSQGGRPEIVAAGHEAVALPSYGSITASSLTGLSAVLVDSCWTGTNAAVDAAVSAGMSLLVHDRDYASNAGDRLPGTYVFGVTGGSSGADVNFTAAARFLSGPAGLLDNSTIDNGSSSNHGVVLTASLAPAIRVLATGTSPAEAIILEYAHGSGRVVYSTIPLGCYLTSGSCARPGGGLEVVSAGMQRYTTNLVATYAVPAFTSCAAEGFIGSKLTLCRQICEVDQPSSTLINKIKLYTAIYRQAPPCGL